MHHTDEPDMATAQRLARGVVDLDHYMKGQPRPGVPKFPLFSLDKGFNFLAFTHSYGKRVAVSLGFASQDEDVLTLSKLIGGTLIREDSLYWSASKGCVCLVLNPTRGFVLSACLVVFALKQYPLLQPQLYQFVENVLKLLFH